MGEGRQERELNQGRRISGRSERIWIYDTRAGQLRINRRAGKIIKSAALDSSKRVLEIGCGPGEYTRRLLKTGAWLVGLDISPELLGENKKNLSPLGVNYVQADIELMPFKSSCFDAVVGNAVLHHLDTNRIFPEIKRVLVPGGVMAFTEPNMLNPQIFLVRKFKGLRRKSFTCPHEVAYVRWVMKRKLEKGGYREVRVRPIDFIHPRIPGFVLGIWGPLARMAERIPLIKEIAGSVFIFARRPSS